MASRNDHYSLKISFVCQQDITLHTWEKAYKMIASSNKFFAAIFSQIQECEEKTHSVTDATLTLNPDC